MEYFDIVTKHGDAAGTAIVAGIAVFKAVDPPQAELSGSIAGQAEELPDHRLVEKLQAFALTGVAGGPDTDFARFQAVQPEPCTAGRQTKE